MSVAGLAAAASLSYASPATAAVPGLVRISNASVSDSADFKSITAVCPATSPTLVGTGYEVNGATGEVVIDDLVPNSGSVTVGAYEEDPFAGNWSVTAYAICADEPAGLVHVSAAGTSNSNDFRSVSATCSAGEGLIGTGFALNGATGEAVVDDFRPNGGTATAPTSNTVGAYEAEAFAGNWSLTTYAVCADTLPGLVRRSDTTVSNSNDFNSITVSCLAGTVLVGTGYEINGATGEVVVDDFRPNGGTATAPTAVTVGAYEAEPLVGNWTLTAYAICANA
jgi:hypothetical protein